MHHKFVVRDGPALWTGSTNWTLDSWSREENVIATLESPRSPRAYTRTFDELWRSGRRRAQRRRRPRPGRGRRRHGARVVLARPRAGALGPDRRGDRPRPQRRVRIASPVITAAPILATLAQEVVRRRGSTSPAWSTRPRSARSSASGRPTGTSSWKLPLLERTLEGAPFSGKRSTPYAPGSVHDYMHAKVTVADDTVFVGSFNLSHSGERNAENVLEIEHAPLAERIAAYIDEIRALYPPADVPLGASPASSAPSRTCAQDVLRVVGDQDGADVVGHDVARTRSTLSRSQSRRPPQ